MREILNGLIDLHVHAGPSVANRSVDAADMLSLAAKAGYRAFVVKDHYFPTMMSAQIVEKHLNNTTGIRVFGGIALNNSVGLFNLNALDAAYGMGAKFVWMPTVSAKRHIDAHEGHFPGSGNMIIPENPVYYLDDKGQLKEEVVAVLKFIAERPDLILATGHGSVEEIDALIHKAVEMKVDKIFVNHPHFLIGATMEDIDRWAKLGAYIELNAGVFQNVGAQGEVPLSTLEKIMEIVPIKQLVLDSDFGQVINGDPVERHYKYLEILMKDLHVTEQQINLMGKETPAMLLGI